MDDDKQDGWKDDEALLDQLDSWVAPRRDRLIILYNDGHTALVKWPAVTAVGLFTVDRTPARVVRHDFGEAAGPGGVTGTVVWNCGFGEDGPLTAKRLLALVTRLGLDPARVRTPKQPVAPPVAPPSGRLSITGRNGSVPHLVPPAVPAGAKESERRQMTISKVVDGVRIRFTMPDGNGPATTYDMSAVMALRTAAGLLEIAAALTFGDEGSPP